jgi:hypothetical protein
MAGFAAVMLLMAPPVQFADFPANGESSTVIRGDMRVDRIIDWTNGVVCYIGQHHNGSSHTTPAISCLKLK